jgi:hypothetical protein
MEIWKYRDMDMGDSETWRNGHGDIAMEIWAWRRGHENGDMESTLENLCHCSRYKVYVV